MDADEDDDDTLPVPGERITLVQALLESRLPELPPAGTIQPQEPILIHASDPAIGEDGFPATSSLPDALSYSHSISRPPEGRRRRWSVLGSIFNPTGSQDMRTSSRHDSLMGSPVYCPAVPESDGRPLARSLSGRAQPLASTIGITSRPSTSGGPHPPHTNSSSPVPTASSSLGSAPPHHLLPRFFSAAFSSRRSDDRPPTLVLKNVDMDSRKNNVHPMPTPQVPPPKLEYVKLPGTKGSLLIKAVETQKKRYGECYCKSFPPDFMVASWLFSVERTVRRWSCLLARIEQLLASLVLLFSRTLLSPLNYSCKEMTLWRFFWYFHRMFSDWNLQQLGCGKSVSGALKEEPLGGG